jgi:hypothetical protein
MQHHHPGSKRSHGKGSKEATFTALTAEFELDDRIRTLFLTGPMETLQDFCFYFTDEEEIDAFVAANVTLGDQERKIQTARMRRAWAAVKQNELKSGNHRTISSAAQLYDLAEEATLREVKGEFSELLLQLRRQKEVEALGAADNTMGDQEQKTQPTTMRQAWSAVKQNKLRNGNHRTILSASELDDLVEEGTLREIKGQLWKRHSTKHPVDITLSDHLLSRSYKGLR